LKRFDCREIELKGKNLIEASAGTGKTYSIALLFLRMVLEGMKADSILTVTFTNAATAELKSRIINFLKTAGAVLDGSVKSDCPDEIRDIISRYEASAGRDTVVQRLAAASKDMDNVQIFTIHGFCRRMLADNAFEAGVLFNMEIAPDIEETVRGAVESFWRREIQHIPADVLPAISSGRWFSIEGLMDLVKGRRNVIDLVILPESGKDSLSWEHKGSIFNTGDDGGLCSDLVVLFRRLLTEVNGAVAVETAKNGATGFDDLLKLIDAALNDPAKKDILISSMKKKYSAVLIDEFQDTDSLQYSIFERLFGGGHHVMFFIGDPKQAIYSFRNADVFAYLEAKKKLNEDRQYTMDVNYRSSRMAVNAVKAVFRRENPFVIPDIPLPEVESSSEEENGLYLKGVPVPGMEIKFIRKDAALPFELSSDRSRMVYRVKHDFAKRKAVSDICASIIEMLKEGSAYTITEKNTHRELKPSDIAVLVNSNTDAELVRNSFSKYGIPFVMASNTSVFESDEAFDMLIVLEAMFKCIPGRIKAALLTRFFGRTADDIIRLSEDAPEMEKWYGFFSRLGDIWERHGFLVAFSELLEEEGTYGRISSGGSGERRLTNVRHLMELMNRNESDSGISPEASLRWFKEKMNGKSSSEDEQLRLESDDNAVTITTVHKSKGLTYPVVFCPDLWRKAEVSNTALFHSYHDDSGRPVMDFNVKDREAAGKHVSELLSENLRLVYVALTRARYTTVIYWGTISGNESTPFAYLFHGEKGFVKTAGDEKLMNDLVNMEKNSNNSVKVSDVISVPQGILKMKKGRGSGKGPLRLHSKIVPQWVTGSFSSLTSGHLSGETFLETPPDEVVPEDDSVPSEGILAFPAGAKAGVVLHSVFEEMDFSDRDAGGLISKMLDSAGMRYSEKGDDMTPWVLDCVNAVLDAPLFNGKSLRNVEKRNCVAEMEFFFHTDNFDTKKITGLLKEKVALRESSFKGFIRGFMDLVFKLDGKYYLLDWKSNRLGSKVSDYGPVSMEMEMKKHNYVLQYMLYLSALDKYLKLRDPDYSYERDFGGVYYIFLRGVTVANGYVTGIFEDRPSQEMLNEFNSIIG